MRSVGGWRRIALTIPAVLSLGFSCVLVDGPRLPAPDAAAPGPDPIVNGSFEAGRAPWFSMDNPYWGTFAIVSAPHRSGEHSLLLRLRGHDDAVITFVQGAVQDLRGDALPEHLRGYYRVEGWRRGGQNQYVQALVSVTGADNLPDPTVPKQIAWVLTGVLDPVWELPNRAFRIVGPAEPREGEWIPFDLEVRQAFLDHYGVVPTGFEELRLYLEVRFENRDPAIHPLAAADVYFDDLSAGDAP